jgi:hypothetical protein
MAVAVAGCQDTQGLPPATFPNVVDTVRVYALRGTPVDKPSGYFVPTRQVVRTDQPGFDVAFDIDDTGAPLLYPSGALGLGRDAGVLKVDVAFEAVETAPTGNAYATQQPLAIPPETVFVVRSAPYGGDCALTGALPRYGKFRVLSIDPATRSVSLEALVDMNCGYRDLRPGLPAA